MKYWNITPVCSFRTDKRHSTTGHNYKEFFTKQEYRKPYVKTSAVRPWPTMNGKNRLSRFYENGIYIKMSSWGVSFMKIGSVNATVYSRACVNFYQYSPYFLTWVNFDTGTLHTISWSNRGFHENWCGESHVLLNGFSAISPVSSAFFVGFARYLEQQTSTLT